MCPIRPPYPVSGGRGSSMAALVVRDAHLHAPAFKLRHDKPRPRHCRIVRSAEASRAASLSTDDPQGRKHNLWKQSVDRVEEHAALGGGGPGGAAAACGEMDCVAHVEDLNTSGGKLVCCVDERDVSGSAVAGRTGEVEKREGAAMTPQRY